TADAGEGDRGAGRATADARADALARVADQWLRRLPRHALARAQEVRREQRAHRHGGGVARDPVLHGCRTRGARTDRGRYAPGGPADRSEPAPDESWSEAARHYGETQLASLVLSIGLINLWNRLNATTSQATGPWIEQYI